MQLNVHPFADLASALTWAKDAIDNAAGRARSRYLTIVPGQEATYTAKYADAKAFLAAGMPIDKVADYPWVKNEAEATGKSYQEAAVITATVGDAWHMQLGPGIEALRMGGKAALAGLTTMGEVVAHQRAVVAQLDAV